MPGKQLQLEQYLPFALVAAANAVSAGASRSYLDRFGIGVTEWRVLANLKIDPGITANAICVRSRLDKAAVSRAVATLAAGGHLIAEGNEGDRRKRGLRLTPAGVVLHDAVIDVALDRERRLLDGLSDENRRQLFGALARVLENASAMDNG